MNGFFIVGEPIARFLSMENNFNTVLSIRKKLEKQNPPLDINAEFQHKERPPGLPDEQ